MRSMPGAMPPCGGAPSESACSMPPNFFSSTSLVVAGDREGLFHDFRAVITDRARRQFDAVADDVVLDRLDRQQLVLVVRIEREEFLDRQVRHRERVVGEVDLLLFLVPLVHREIDDPAELEAVLGDQPKLFADLRARRAGEFDEILRLAGDEEHGVADAELELIGDLLRAFRPDFLASGPAPPSSPSRQKI